MQYLPDTRVLTLGLKPCTACFGRGTGPTILPCPTNGRGPRGGARGCRTCNGFGRHYDHDTPVPCDRCHGEPADKEPETFYDSAPVEALEALIPTLKVARVDRGGTWNEAHLGMGALWSITDYGRAWNRDDDDALIADIAEKLRKDRVQAINIVQPFDRADTAATLVEQLTIVLHRDGYKLIAMGSHSREGWARVGGTV